MHERGVGWGKQGTHNEFGRGQEEKKKLKPAGQEEVVVGLRGSPWDAGSSCVDSTRVSDDEKVSELHVVFDDDSMMLSS